MKLGFVVPRYGETVVGGAETLARSLALHLPPDRFEVDILTTCASNHHTWENDLAAGESRDEHLRVQRFPVDGRDLDTWVPLQIRLAQGGSLTLDEELAWARSGVNSEALYAWMAAEAENFDAFLFLPYLFGTTLLGSQVAPERSILLPCLHDESYAYTRLVRHAFETTRGCVFNAAPERALAERLFEVAPGAPVVGLGFDPPDDEGAASAAGVHSAVDAFRSRRGVEGDYLVYFGRKEGGKNLPLLLEYFASCPEAGRGLSLVVAGDGAIPESDRSPGVIDLPRLSEAEKRSACAGALALCQLSTNESFSIVLMEAWLEGTPVIVHAGCDVTRHHAASADAGFWVRDAREFAAVARELATQPELAARLGQAGRDYVAREYSWPAVIDRFESGVAHILEAA